MIHGDNKGVVFPPKVAPKQIVIVPVYKKNDDIKAIIESAEEIYARLKKLGLRVHLDDREGTTAGRKYNEWEMKGVPLRLELGPKDFAKQEVRMVRRVDGFKEQVKISDLETLIPKALDNVHDLMFERAKKKMESKIAVAYDWENFMGELNKM